jgi:hypothetical protein
MVPGSSRISIFVLRNASTLSILFRIKGNRCKSVTRLCMGSELAYFIRVNELIHVTVKFAFLTKLSLTNADFLATNPTDDYVI